MKKIRLEVTKDKKTLSHRIRELLAKFLGWNKKERGKKKRR